LVIPAPTGRRDQEISPKSLDKVGLFFHFDGEQVSGFVSVIRLDSSSLILENCPYLLDKVALFFQFR